MCPAAVGKGSTECISTPDRRRSGVFHRFQNRSGKEYKYEDLCTLHNCIRIASAIRAWVWIASGCVNVIKYNREIRNSRVGVDCQSMHT